MHHALRFPSLCALARWQHREAERDDSVSARNERHLGEVFETQKALQDGAEEVDVVVNVSRVVSGDFGYVRDELAEITQHVHAARAKIKVIFETCFLDEAQKSRCARSAVTSEPIGRRRLPGSPPKGQRVTTLPSCGLVALPKCKSKRRGGYAISTRCSRSPSSALRG